MRKRKIKTCYKVMGWGVFILLIGFILFEAYLLNNNPKFKITKQVCEEKPQYSYFDFVCEDGSSGRINVEQLLSFFKNNTKKVNCNFDISIDYETICYEEEVVTFDKNKNYLSYNCDSYGGCNAIYIEDLTTEFLDENAEWFCYDSESGILLEGDPENFGGAKVGNRNIPCKYKLENYTIEVSR